MPWVTKSLKWRQAGRHQRILMELFSRTVGSRNSSIPDLIQDKIQAKGAGVCPPVDNVRDGVWRARSQRAKPSATKPFVAIFAHAMFI